MANTLQHLWKRGWRVISLLVIAVIPLSGRAISIVPEKCQSELGCGICDIADFFINLSNIIAGSLSGISLLMFIVGGLFLVMSAGNEQRIETGKKILVGTVTGVAIVFGAWFAINFVVRIAYQGANSNLTTDNTTTEASVTVFGKATNWWSLPACDPVSTPGTGKYIGEVCGSSGECTDSNSTNCTCFRTINSDPKEGDNRKCSTENTTSDIGSATFTDNACFCASPCAQVTYDTKRNAAGKEYLCVTQEVYDVDQDSVKNYTKHDDISCPSTDQVCVNKK